jgi:Enoyl-(Acyl carrier protein) reductase
VANSLHRALDDAELVRISLIVFNIDQQHLGRNLEVELGVASMIASIADEVAYAILFLASNKSSYIRGSEIHMDGGGHRHLGLHRGTTAAGHTQLWSRQVASNLMPRASASGGSAGTRK